MSKQTDDPLKARYIRKIRKAQGQDEQQQQQDQQFSKDRTKALRNYSKEATQKDIENQINYFGNIIEPFNLRRQEEMGNIDDDGFFIFNNKRNRIRDGWLQSIQQAEDQEIAQKLRKRIKEGGRYQTVFQANRQINKDCVEQQQQQQNEDQQQQDKNESKQQPDNQQEGFSAKEIIQLLVDMLPENKSANQYLKQLKKQKNQQLYDKILELCNQYIQKTSQHNILTKKREDLEEELQDNKQQSPELNWDVDAENQDELAKEQKPKDNQENDDNIW